jgi:hypothetical protein
MPGDGGGGLCAPGDRSGDGITGVDGVRLSDLKKQRKKGRRVIAHASLRGFSFYFIFFFFPPANHLKELPVLPTLPALRCESLRAM